MQEKKVVIVDGQQRSLEEFQQIQEDINKKKNIKLQKLSEGVFKIVKKLLG